jgi:DNA-binding response OmpR family regulator
MEILIAEDEKHLAESLKKNFNAEHHSVYLAYDGVETLSAVKKFVFDIILLDWRMPKKNGLEVCKELRKSGIQTPIILLTALNDISNKVEALNAGADDYITKPFSFEEVMARINAVLRRYYSTTTTISFDNFTLNLIDHVLESPKGIIKLSDKEFELLRYFLTHKGLIINKEEICKNVWNIECSPLSNIVEVTVKNLRHKLEEHSPKKYIKTIYGEGYIFFGK